jgi:hypothetical protein
MAVSLIGDPGGQLAASKGTLFTLSGSGAVKLTYVNGSGSQRTVNAYTKRGAGTSKRISPKDLVLDPGAEWTSPLLTFDSGGGLIEGDASAATTIDFSVNGFEVA